MKEYAILLDSTYCTGCNTCMYKCIQENGLHEAASRGLTRTLVNIDDDGLYHHRCMQCKEPVCVEDCPEGALKKSEYGPVLYDAKACVGCKTCVDSCPFHVPRFDSVTRKIVRCSMCAHRVKQGREPACAEACPTGALTFGEYDKLAAMAQTRASRENLHLYGLKENGGGHFLVLMKGDPAAAGYPKVAYRDAKRNKLAADLSVPGVAALAIGGLKIFSDRRAKVEAETREK